MNAGLIVLMLSLGDAPEPEVAPVVDEAPPEAAPEEPAETDAGQTIVARRRDLRRVAGSAHVVDNETLERFEPDDVHRALRGVPGVYVRDEDGLGLRPNIGLRGSSSDRSAKVALLEDGVLFAPAPYAAPAAYYFPLTSRITAIEVFKGPAAIRQGPHTVGGAINLRTRAIPMDPLATLDVGVGVVGNDLSRDQSRLHGAVGTGDETWGVLLEGARVGTDGFKRLQGDEGANTGFVRDDVMLKARLGSSLMDEVRHNVEVKLGFGREESHETYLGLTDADFAADPFQRYAATGDDFMEWTRTQAQLRYSFALGEDLELDATVYRHDLDRSWNKVNGVRGAPPLHDVLSFPDAGSFPLFMQQLRGGDGSVPGEVLIGPNHRTYLSQGVATTLRGRLAWGPVEQRLEAGVRLHNDSINRLHSERAYSVVRGAVVDNGEDEVITAENTATATALATHFADEIRFLDVTLVPGMRVELIRGTFVDRKAGGAPVDSEQVALLPGLGAAWQPLPALVVLAGLHRGFSPIAPGQSADIRPEESTNVEGGVRVDLKRALGVTAEAIGFYNHYENILGECTYSSGCVLDVGTQTNGGTAGIGGLELSARQELRLPFTIGDDDARLRNEASYTFTRAVFLTSFESAHPLFGQVTAGDEMAYVPMHQAAYTSALVMGPVDLGLSVGLVSAMRDVPGQGEAPAHELTDTQSVVDVAASWEIVDGIRLALRADNVLDQRAIVSRRPFGARPGKPRSVLVSVEMNAF